MASILLGSWLRHPYNKRQIDRRKNKSLITCLFPVYMGETQENRVAQQNGRSHHRKYHLQLKTKDVRGRGVSQGGDQEKHSDKGKVVKQT